MYYKGQHTPAANIACQNVNNLKITENKSTFHRKWIKLLLNPTVKTKKILMLASA